MSDETKQTPRTTQPGNDRAQQTPRTAQQVSDTAKQGSETFSLDWFSARTLIIAPDYPTNEDPYLCAFVHSRVKAYQEAGIACDVAVCFDRDECRRYRFEGVDVVRCRLVDLRTLLQNRVYDTIAVHFMHPWYQQVFDVCDLSRTRLLIWEHGAESLYHDSPLFTTPYFQPLRKINNEEALFYEKRDAMLRQLNDNPNVTFVPVSDFVRRRGEELLGFSYRDARVINNFIDTACFVFSEKDPELRKHVFCVRKFDDCNNYALDTVVRCILELSRRSCFSDMSFSIFGTGPTHELITAPLRGFENVHIEDRFLTHDQIAAEHAKNGIALFPTRFDAQGVSMCEAAASGLAVVSTKRDSVADFLPDDRGLLADVDDYVAYADIIEGLYRDPKRFTDCACACHDKVVERCGFDKTVAREIALFEEEWHPSGGMVLTAEVGKRPILTIAVIGGIGMPHPFEQLLDTATRARVEIVDANDVAEAARLAHGIYFKAITPQDGFDRTGLTALLDLLENLVADRDAGRRELPTVLADHAFYRAGMTEPEIVGGFGFLIPGQVYPFEDLCWPGYGFGPVGPDRYTAVFPLRKVHEAIASLPQAEPEFIVSGARALLASDRLTYLPAVVCRRRGFDAGARYVPRYDDWGSLGDLSALVDKIEALEGLSSAKRNRIIDFVLAPAVAHHYDGAIGNRDARAFSDIEGVVRRFENLYNHPRVASDLVKFHRRTDARFLGAPLVARASCHLYRTVRH